MDLQAGLVRLGLARGIHGLWGGDVPGTVTRKVKLINYAFNEQNKLERAAQKKNDWHGWMDTHWFREEPFVDVHWCSKAKTKKKDLFETKNKLSGSLNVKKLFVKNIFKRGKFAIISQNRIEKEQKKNMRVFIIGELFSITKDSLKVSNVELFNNYFSYVKWKLQSSCEPARLNAKLARGSKCCSLWWIVFCRDLIVVIPSNNDFLFVHIFFSLVNWI